MAKDFTKDVIIFINEDVVWLPVFDPMLTPLKQISESMDR